MENNLKAIRKSRTKLTQEAAAAGLGMKLETYRKWEQGRVSLNAVQLKKLADFYDCTIDEICSLVMPVSHAGVVAFQEDLDDLGVCFFNMDDEARDALLGLAHHLAELFPRDGR